VNGPGRDEPILPRVSILDAIGNTSMVRLRKVVPDGCADIFVKLEWENPTGSGHVDGGLGAEVREHGCVPDMMVTRLRGYAVARLNGAVA